MRAVTKRFIVYNLITSVLSAVMKAKNLIGDVPKWLKGPDSKSGRSASPAQEFESLHLRQEGAR